MPDTPTKPPEPINWQQRWMEANYQLNRTRHTLMELGRWRELAAEEYAKENDGDELPKDTFQDFDQWCELEAACKTAAAAIWDHWVQTGWMKGEKCK